MNGSNDSWSSPSSYPDPGRNPRRAGDSRRPSGGNGPELRDWQKDTWVGDAPLYENPFDEAESAPELLQMRSDNLNNREGEFWNGQPEGQRDTGNTRSTERKVEKTSGSRFFLRVTFAAASLAAIAAVLYFAVFTVREIHVTGNKTRSPAEIIGMTGISVGMPILSIDENAAIRGVESDPFLQVRYVERSWDGNVTIGVKEREACCWTNWCGIMYVLDRDRVVLYETEDPDIQPADLVRADGLGIRSGTVMGQPIALNSQDRETVYTNLFLEMKILGCTASVESADLSNLNSLLLTDRNGFTIALGDERNLHAKLRAMILTRDELLLMGYTRGTINVNNPENPIFTP